jgi:hypothetical protein
VEEWRAKLLEKSKDDYCHRVQDAVEARDVRDRAIMGLVSSAIVFGGPHVYILTNNHKNVHAMARVFKETLVRSVQYDGLNYIGKSVTLYGAGLTAPGCTLVKKTRVVPEHEESYYEMDCSGVVKHGGDTKDSE